MEEGARQSPDERADGAIMIAVRHLPSSAEPVAASSSGVEPVFLSRPGDTPVRAGHLSELINHLGPTDAPLIPDWDAWAEILALGAPLAGRTPFAGIHRLQPAESARVEGQRWQVTAEPWAWESVEVDLDLEPQTVTGEVLDALRASITRLNGPLNPMLSGGRDSRLLTALAAQHTDDLTAWTTSSDTGTTLEELVAARVAGVLGVRQLIVPGHHDRFADDVLSYARTVDFMASFHIWLMPVADELRQHPGTILDGLGGGVFLGGGFPDSPEVLDSSPSPLRLVDTRFARMARYLDAADDILAPGLADELIDRSRADFDPIARTYAEHPNGATLTAYLTRTLPGISLAPSRVLGGAQPTVMPIMDDDVITLALRVPHQSKLDGIWYPDLLAHADDRLTDMLTAADLTGRRQHVRRGASRAAAEWYRNLMLNSPVAELLSERMRTAETPEWSDQLAKTKPQHLIRGLAMLALWLNEYGNRLDSTEIPWGRKAHG